MKKRLSALVCASLVSFLFPGLAGAGTLITGRSLDFTEADFTDGSATKSWSINRPGVDGNGDPYGPDTLLWAASGADLGYVGGTTRIFMSNASATAGFVTWKFTVPENMSITGFEWGVRQVMLNGAASGDDVFEWQYSLDQISWTTFFTRENSNASLVTLNSQKISQSISATAVGELYIRAVHIEGAGVAGDSGYWAVMSNTTSYGGENAASYIRLTVQPIPEPAHVGLLMGVVGLAGGACLRRRSGRGRAVA